MRTKTYASDVNHYVHQLDLGADPFEPGFRSDYFYDGGQRRQILEAVLHYTRFSDQVVMLLGSTGNGTSTILDRLLDQLEPLMDFCAVDAEAVTTPEQLLETLATQLQFADIDSATAFVAALRFHAKMLSTDEPLLVAVDQAHFLGIESLEMLRVLYEQSGGLVHILLAGEYQVEQLARLAGFDPARVKLHELEPLQPAETGEYLLGLLHSVGYAGEQPLDAEQLAMLQEQSGGNISEINLLAPELLVPQPEARSKLRPLSIPWPHVAAIGMLLIVVGASYWYRPGGDAVSSEGIVNPPAAERNAVAVTLPLGEAGGADATTDIEIESGDAGRADLASIPAVQSLDDPAKDIATGDRDASGAADSGSSSSAAKRDAVGSGADSAAQVSIAEEAAPGQGVVQRAPQQPLTTDAREAAAAPAVAIQETGEKPASGTGAAVPSGESKTVAATSGSAVQSDRSAVSATNGGEKKPQSAALPSVSSSVKSTASSPTQVATSSAASKEVAPTSDEQRLLKMPENAFALQLMGSLDETRTRNFVSGYRNSLPVYYFQTARNGKPWFVVVAAPYDDKQAARAAVAQLPEKLRRLQPWVRGLNGIQDEIRDR